VCHYHLLAGRRAARALAPDALRWHGTDQRVTQARTGGTQERSSVQTAGLHSSDSSQPAKGRSNNRSRIGSNGSSNAKSSSAITEKKKLAAKQAEMRRLAHRYRVRLRKHHAENDVAGGLRVFEEMKNEPDAEGLVETEVYNVVLSLCKDEPLEVVDELLQSMREDGVPPNEGTTSVLLRSFADRGEFVRAVQVSEELWR
jgi:pentatricopeptide repeat protein